MIRMGLEDESLFRLGNDNFGDLTIPFKFHVNKIEKSKMMTTN